MKRAAILKCENGSQLLEFVLVSPLVWLLFLFAADQFTIMYNKQKALSAAYEAGRIACVQPNAGLARYHGGERGMEELAEAIGMDNREVKIQPQGRWEKGNHVKATAIVRFWLIASGEPYTVEEEYSMMIENAEDQSR